MKKKLNQKKIKNKEKKQIENFFFYLLKCSFIRVYFQ